MCDVCDFIKFSRYAFEMHMKAGVLRFRPRIHVRILPQILSTLFTMT